jgi:hypothetical protein
MNYQSLAKPKSHAGFMFLELIIGIMVLMTALSIGLMAYNQSVASRRLRERRDAAREAVTLMLERLRAFNAAALPKPGESLDLGVPPHLTSALSGATCTLKISSMEPATLVRAHVELRCAGLSTPESGEAVLNAAALPVRAEEKP